MNDLLNLLNRVFLSIRTAIFVLLDITFIGYKPGREVSCLWIVIVTLDGSTEISDLDHLCSPWIDNWLGFVDEFFGNTVHKNDKMSMKLKNIFISYLDVLKGDLGDEGQYG